MELEQLLLIIPPNININGESKSIVLRYSKGLDGWLCHHGTMKNKVMKKIENGKIGFGKTPKQSVEDYIQKTK